MSPSCSSFRAGAATAPRSSRSSTTSPRRTPSPRSTSAEWAAVIRGVSEWNGREPFARCELPVLLLRAQLVEEIDVLRLRGLKPDLEIGITIGAGHFHQIEVPEQVNAMIERFLALSLRSAAA